MITIALTGGIATGKSKVAEIWHNLGIPVISADDIAHEVIKPALPAWQELKKTFDPSFFNDDGTVDRTKLGKYVFSHPAELKKLEAIIHPHVKKEMFRLLEAFAREGKQAVLAEIPLLFEAGWDKFFTFVVVVYVPMDVQLARLMARDNISYDAALSKLKAQMPLEHKIKKADFVVDNSKDILYTEEQVKKIWQLIKKDKGL